MMMISKYKWSVILVDLFTQNLWRVINKNLKMTRRQAAANTMVTYARDFYGCGLNSLISTTENAFTFASSLKRYLGYTRYI